MTKTALLNRATELGVQSWDEEELIMSTDEHVLKQCTEFTMIVSGPYTILKMMRLSRKRRRKYGGNLVLPEKLSPISGDNALCPTTTQNGART